MSSSHREGEDRMILYFSATGNTQYVADCIAKATKDTVVSIRNCMHDKRYSFHLQDNESLGIIMPTYFQGMPLFLQEFVEKLTVTMEGAEHYAYAVATCGVNYGNFGSEAVRTAKKAGIHLDATFCIHMVDNWNPYFDMTDKEYIEKAERNAEADIAKICTSIVNREKGVYLEDNFNQNKEKELAVSYEESRKTELFKVSDSCINCGVCTRQCPAGAIGMKNERPIWIKEKCFLCLGCVHKCPRNAIAYTEATIGHGQYTNPHVTEIL